MSDGSDMIRRDRFQACLCGKRGWSSKEEADQVVVNAKILRSLHSNNRRQEQRSYRCTVNAGLWHVTSTPLRTLAPRYRAHEDKRAREYVEALLLAEVDRPTVAEWRRLLTEDNASAVNAILSGIHQDGLKDGAERKAKNAEVQRAAHRGQIPRGTALASNSDYRMWVLHWTRFQALLVARKAWAKRVTSETNIARSASDVALASQAHREAVRRVALAVQAHRDATEAPTAADRELWRVLYEVEIPYRAEMAPLVRVLEESRWHDEADPAACVSSGGTS